MLTGRIGGLAAPWWVGSCSPSSRWPRWCRPRPGSRSWSAGSSPPSPRCSPRCSATSPLSLAATDTQAGVGFLVVVLQACFIAATVIAGQRLDLRRVGARLRGSGRSRSWSWPPSYRWSASAGGSPAPTTRSPTTRRPTSRRTWCSARRPEPEHGILVVRGDVDERPDLHASAGVTASPSARTRSSASPARTTRSTPPSAPSPPGPPPRWSTTLADRGIEYVVLPAPADGSVAAALDATGGLVQASAERPRDARLAGEPAPRP